MVNWFSYITSFELVKVDSPLNGEIKVVESFGKRTLLVNNAEQSGGTITGMWEKAIWKIKQCNNVTMEQCLILGLGGGTVIKLLDKYCPELAIDVVEFDPVIIDIYNKYFAHKSQGLGGVKIIHADAFTWIKKAKKKYDLVIFDLYLGKYNPEKSRQMPFLKDLKELLSRSGIILFNAHFQNNKLEYGKLLRECLRVFSHAELLLSYPFSRILKIR